MIPDVPDVREKKIRKLTRRVSDLCGPFYEHASFEQRAECLRLCDALEDALIRYRAYKIPWDSQLINVVKTIPAQNGNQAVRFKTKAFSTHDSVMDLARELYAFLALCA